MKTAQHNYASRQQLTSAPPGFDAEQFFHGIRWHQRWPLFRDVETPGVNPVLEICDLIGLPQDLSGKRVLDVGANNGCFSFECERRGAAEIVALSLENPHKSGIHQLKRLLGSRVQYVQDSAYNISPDQIGKFDVVLFLGVLYHLRYPLLAIDRIRTVCSGELFVETFVTTSRHLLSGRLAFLSRWLGLGGLFHNTPLWRQLRSFEIHPTGQSNWFGPNVAAVKEAFSSAGFNIQHLHTYGGERATFHATVQQSIPDRLANGCLEGLSACHASLAGLKATPNELFAIDCDSQSGKKTNQPALI